MVWSVFLANRGRVLGEIEIATWLGGKPSPSGHPRLILLSTCARDRRSCLWGVGWARGGRRAGRSRGSTLYRENWSKVRTAITVVSYQPSRSGFIAVLASRSRRDRDFAIGQTEARSQFPFLIFLSCRSAAIRNSRRDSGRRWNNATIINANGRKLPSRPILGSAFVQRTLLVWTSLLDVPDVPERRILVETFK